MALESNFSSHHSFATLDKLTFSALVYSLNEGNKIFIGLMWIKGNMQIEWQFNILSFFSDFPEEQRLADTLFFIFSSNSPTYRGVIIQTVYFWLVIGILVKHLKIFFGHFCTYCNL